MFQPHTRHIRNDNIDKNLVCAYLQVHHAASRTGRNILRRLQRVGKVHRRSACRWNWVDGREAQDVFKVFGFCKQGLDQAADQSTDQGDSQRGEVASRGLEFRVWIWISCYVRGRLVRKTKRYFLLTFSFLFVRDDNVLSLKCKQYVEMLQGNVLAPYKFVHKPEQYLFRFNYATVHDCLPHILQLLRAATLPTAEQNAMVITFVSKQFKLR